MRLRTRVAGLACMAGLTMVASASLAQVTSAGAPSLRTRTAADALLTVDVICRQRNGAACGSLPAASVRVRLDGRQIPENSVRATREMPQVYFLLDAINTPREDLVRSQEALVDVLRTSRDHLPYQASVLIVADTKPVFKGTHDNVGGWELLKNELYLARIAPSSDGIFLANTLTGYSPALRRIGNAQAGEGGIERVHLSLQSLSFVAAAVKDVSTPKMLLWISPGWPYVHMTQGGLAAQVFDSIVYFDGALRDTRMMLYALDPTGAATDHSANQENLQPILRAGLGQNSAAISEPPSNTGSESYKAFLAPAESAHNADPNDMLLPVLALHSGGTVQAASNDVRGGILHFLDDTGAMFSVSFPALESGKGIYHPLSLDTPSENDILRTRSGFYAK